MPELKRNLSVGEIIANDYKILGIAGAGGMGVVYRARDLKLERIVALKFLPPELRDNATSRHRILREARTASNLDHPNIGVIHGIEEIGDGSSCIVMAYYDGQTLAERIRNNPLSPTEALDIAIQMARGLAEAHAHKVIHRDIKPSNVMLTASGGVRIVDFGLASAANSETASQTGMAGTIAYMSPEQAMGNEFDHRTDIWALGCVLAEMLIGHGPFDRDTVPSMIVAILNESPRGLDSLPPGLQQVLYRALAKGPAERYSDCAEILADLESLRRELAQSPAIGIQKPLRPSAGIRKAREQASVSLWGAPPPRHRSRLVTILLLAGALLFAAAGILTPYIHSHFFHTASAASAKHIAVLPFNNIGGNPENAVLVQGLMDSLAGRLSNLGSQSNSLWVVPTSEVRRLSITDPADAFHKLGATLAIQGSVERNGNDVRLNLALIDTRDLRQIGSADVDDRAGDLSTLQDEAVARLAQLMNVPEVGGSLRASGSAASPAAYEDYLRALGYMQRYDKPGNLDQAVAALQQSIQTDPRFALAYAELGETYRIQSTVTKDPKWLAEAEANAQKAAEIDSNIPAVFVTLGRIHETTGKHDLAVQEFQRALNLDPHDADAETGLALAYESAGRISEAEAAFQKAAALRPDSWKGYSALGGFYDRQNRYPEAVKADQHAIQLTPDNAQVYSNLGGACIDSADPKLLPVGEQALRKSLQIAPSYAAYANLGDLLLTEHRPAEAEAALEKALKISSGDYAVWNFLMLADQWQKKDADAADARHHAEALAEQA
ncbi:MAG: protein kinase, partial [Acidobacteriaceae bacterium]